MKYKLVTDGEKFAVQRRNWFLGKEYISRDSGVWWSITSEYMSRCWMDEKTARDVLARLRNEKKIYEVAE